MEHVKLMPGCRALALLQSKDQKDHKLSKRLQEYCRKAEACNYDWQTVQKLRKEFKDVL